MKLKFKYTLWAIPLVMFTACKKDNYKEPKSKFTGAIVYKGDTIRMATQQVTFELWQSGFGKMTPINVNVNQDGTFSALLFNGQYKLDIPAGQGPFMADHIDTKTNSDTLAVSINGNTNLNIEVLPFYMIKNASFSLSGNAVKSSCGLEQVITDANAKGIDNVTLFINKTEFVDNNNNIASTGLNGADITDMNAISLQVNIPDLIPKQDYIFARIGVKISNVEDMLFSPVVKIQLK